MVVASSIHTIKIGRLERLTPKFENTVCIRDLDKFNLIWQFDFNLKQIFALAPAASKSATHFKSDQKWP